MRRITTEGPVLRWVAVLLAGALLLLGLVWLLPGRDGRFADSASQMEAVARTLRKDEVLGRQTIGALTFDTVYWDGDTVVFALSNSYRAYIWSPDRRPGDTLPLWGPWYTFWSDPH
ncbi:hypothetical protein OIE67_46335 [Nonomuraea fuscirosea]|uniref:hypothetical protein n=1 Tax=Nonomuraea fuscirosea TaxID=1291556 RepID=UPI002DDC1B26|nr:hypothetical protein [Nonomuraea fuscirosea]WSA51393.1 hypothetical protein OIE67_46335 [Nonomuraea fuscirosea]